MGLTFRRKHYIDNLRSFALLMLFPYHIFMIYNNWGENWYIHGKDLLFPSFFNMLAATWMMPLLFVLAGMSSRYSLETRRLGEYAKERVHKLLLPLIFGLLLVIPIQSYLAGLYFNDHANYLDYFTKVTDLSGYDGMFTPGQLWFILFLFVFSMISLPFMRWYKNKGKGTLGGKAPLIFIILMGLIPVIGNEILEIGGKSPTENLAYFLLGYFFLSNDDLLERLDKYRFLLLGLFVLGAGLTYYFNGFLYEFVSWVAVLTLLGMARHYLDFSGKITGYLSKSSFGVYIFHQSWIVITAFFILKITDVLIIQIPLIFISAIALTYLTHELCKRTAVTRWMFGLKK